MASVDSDSHALRYVPRTVRGSVKILIAGDFGVGKTTLVASVSEITPLRTEETLTALSAGVDSLAGRDNKTRTTAALDFGRITLNAEVALYLFGMPGQRRFWPLWEGLAEGAVGALLLVDTARLAGAFEVVDQNERYGLPYVVAINLFDNAYQYPPDQVRDALAVPATTPVMECDARERHSSAQALATLVEHALTRPAGAAQ